MTTKIDFNQVNAEDPKVELRTLKVGDLFMHENRIYILADEIQSPNERLRCLTLSGIEPSWTELYADLKSNLFVRPIRNVKIEWSY